MTRKEFLEKLEYLLQDISEQERQDALDYYQAYMDDAGLLPSDNVDGILESPEVVAASIRRSLNGEEDGADSRQTFREEDGSRQTFREETDSRHPFGEEEGSDRRQADRKGEKDPASVGKIILIIGLCILGLPVAGSLILAAGAAVLGLLLGIAGLFIGIGAAAVAVFLSGIAIFVYGIFKMTVFMPAGVLLLGVGLLIVALGILALIFTIWLFRLIPWMCGGIARLTRRLFRRGGEMA